MHRAGSYDIQIPTVSIASSVLASLLRHCCGKAHHVTISRYQHLGPESQLQLLTLVIPQKTQLLHLHHPHLIRNDPCSSPLQLGCSQWRTTM